MNEEISKKILSHVCENYTKPIDKEYTNEIISREYGIENSLLAKKFVRDRSRDFASSLYDRYRSGKELTIDEENMLPLDSYELAVKAAELVVHRYKEVASYGRVEGLAKHAFCIAGYSPEFTSLNCVEAMAWKGDERAWIIDPWMNIACKFREYPAVVKTKLSKWNAQGKHIRRNHALYAPWVRIFRCF